jgi:hypothetical protein
VLLRQDIVKDTPVPDVVKSLDLLENETGVFRSESFRLGLLWGGHQDIRGEPEVLKEIGSPGWARTSDFLINRRGPVMSRPSVFLHSSV